MAITEELRDYLVKSTLIIYGDRDKGKDALFLPPPDTLDPNGHVHACNSIRMGALWRDDDNPGCVCQLVRDALDG